MATLIRTTDATTGGDIYTGQGDTGVAVAVSDPIAPELVNATSATG